AIQTPGAVGGANWNGAALDPETGVLYVPSVTAPVIMGLRPPPDPARSDLRYRVDLSEADGYAWTQLPNGLPITKPPYGRITAIDLNTGEHLWVAPNGPGFRDHPELADLDLPWLGQPGRASALVTKTLLFLAEGSPDTVVQPPGGGGKMLRAYDKATGEVLAEIELPAGVSNAPMTYLYEGRQYIVVAIGEEGYETELVALALPM
ncbi:MAG: pyrroloquinoline quinone-dependent dehydrogenase, partial [Thermoanaerobaculia bacterium]|nr:pyrroloquinoline quinone-dependent dehydrogenase [Thermoanaerobaculia bacterium]